MVGTVRNLGLAGCSGYACLIGRRNRCMGADTSSARRVAGRRDGTSIELSIGRWQRLARKCTASDDPGVDKTVESLPKISFCEKVAFCFPKDPLLFLAKNRGETGPGKQGPPVRGRPLLRNPYCIQLCGTTTVAAMRLGPCKGVSGQGARPRWAAGHGRIFLIATEKVAPTGNCNTH